VLELIQSGGWLMLPILACSILALALIGERFWALDQKRILPRRLVGQVWHRIKNNSLDAEQLKALRAESPLGRVIAAGLVNLNHDRAVMMEGIEDAGRHEAHGLEKYLNILGTIAAISPLLGLLGTVVGMIKVFSTISAQGLGNAGALAGGISEALITTAAGLVVAIPTLMAYRYFRRKVDHLVVQMEKESLKLVEAIYGPREQNKQQDKP